MDFDKFEPYLATDVDGFIEAGQDLDISESTIAFKEKINGEVIVTYFNVITKHLSALSDYITDYEIDDDMMDTYKYQPKLLSLELYGTPELASSLLYINNMVSVTDFTKTKIKVFTDDILDAIEELMEINEDDLLANSSQIEDTESTLDSDDE